MSVPTEKIIELAQKAGFDAELKMAAVIASAGWRVNQNVYYIDKDERKGRELDIYAYRIFSEITEKPEATCHIDFCVEVKKTSEPFIFFTNEAQEFEGGRGYGMLHWKNKINYKILSFSKIEKNRPNRYMQRIARSYCSFKDGKTNHIQSGVLSAVKGAVHYQDKCQEIYSENSRDICFFIPVVIVDGPIYECFFESNSLEMTAQQVEVILYRQNYLSDNYGTLQQFALVTTPSAFAELLPLYENWGKDMLKSIVKNRNISFENI